MTDEDAAIEDWISSQAAVDNSIIEGTLFREEYSYGYSRRGGGSDESVDAAPWEENLREASAKAIFTFINGNVDNHTDNRPEDDSRNASSIRPRSPATLNGQERREEA